MAYREHGMWEILDVLKRHHRGESQRRIAAATGRGRKTIRAYIREAKKLGWSKEVPPDEALASRVAQRRQPGPSSSEASASEKALRGHHDRIQQWVEGCEGERGLKLTKVHELLTREGVDVSYSSVYRYAAAHFGWARPKLTLRRAEVSPGELAEVDFGQLGKIYDPESDRNRLVWALLVTLGFSRHQYVHVSFSQKLDVVIDGLEEAWEFFGGVPLRVVVDNMKTAVVKSDRYEPIFQRTTEQYAEHRGFVIDPAVARHPTGKPIVERGVQYVRESFFRGEQWLDLAHVQREARRWCMEVAGRRIHGTTQKRPLVVFEQVALACLRPVKGPRFDTPQWATPTVHDDHHEVPQGPVLGSHALCGKASHGPRRQSARTHLLQKRAHQNPPQKTSRRKSDRLLFFTLNREDFSFVIHLDRQPRTSRRREAQTGSRARSGSRSERTLDAVEHSRTLMEWWPFLIFHRGGLRIKVINNTCSSSTTSRYVGSIPHSPTTSTKSSSSAIAAHQRFSLQIDTSTSGFLWV